MKDKAFLDHLRALLDEKELSIELKEGGLKYLVLRQNYGSRIDACFGTTRQGVRWRFQRLFNQVYVSAYETILVIESNFGTGLRQKAMAIAQERYQEWKKMHKPDFPGDRKCQKR